MPVSINGTNGLTFNDGTVQNTVGYSPWRNRIINGDMRIDQRNNGASVTGTSPGYTLDRWLLQGATGSFTVQRTSSIIPAGFSNALGITVASAGTRNAANFYIFSQSIEGFNVADLDLGLSTAGTATISFWVRSSVAGLYSGVLASGDNTRSYGFTYTVNSANTWEQKFITIVGDTSGGKTAYPVDNTTGLRLKLDLGSGSDYQVTAGSWQAASNRSGVSGTVSWAQTAGATFYITGVQLEAGSVATPFERVEFGESLRRCQRYYYKTFPNAATRFLGFGMAFSSVAAGAITNFPVPMRTRPTALEQSGTASHYDVLSAAGVTISNSAVPTFNAVTTEWTGWTTITVASSLVAGNGTALLTANAAAYLAWSAEL